MRRNGIDISLWGLPEEDTARCVGKKSSREVRAS